MFPELLEPPAAARLPFATPDAALMAAWRDGAAAGLMLDLCYGALPCQPLPQTKSSPAPPARTRTRTLTRRGGMARAAQALAERRERRAWCRG